MTVSTYAEHAEHAAQALNALIRDDVIPADEHAVDQLLHCREAVVDALRQRLYDVGQDSWYPPPDHLPARTPKPMLAGLDEKRASLVDNIAFALPTLTLDERRPHADYLTPASEDPTVESCGRPRSSSCRPPTHCRRPRNSRGAPIRAPAGG